MKGVVACATAMSAADRATPLPSPVGKVAGLANLVPKPEVKGYAETEGEVTWATARKLFKTTPPAPAALKIPKRERATTTRLSHSRLCGKS